MSDRDLLTTQFDPFLERYVKAKNTARTAAEVRRLLDREVRTLWRQRRVQDISRRDVIKLLDGIVDRGSPIMANRTLAYVRWFFSWLVERSILDVSPCAGVKPPAAEIDRDRILTDDEIRWLWKASTQSYDPRHGQPLRPVGLFVAATRPAGALWGPGGSPFH